MSVLGTSTAEAGTAASGPAASGPAAVAVQPAPAGRGPRRTALAVVLPPAVLMAALSLWGLRRGTLWRDEATTLDVAQRSAGQILRTVEHIDVVHAAYYLLVHVALHVVGGEVGVRLPSVAAATLTAGVVAAIGLRLAGPRVGLLAGLLYALAPIVSRYAQEGRSPALVALGAAVATLLLLIALDRPGSRWWLGYAVVTTLTVLLNELAVLLLAAHAASLLARQDPRRVWRRWVVSAVPTVVVAGVLALLSRAQRGQLSWLQPPGWSAVRDLAEAFFGTRAVLLWPAVALALVSVAAAVRAPRTALATVALPLTVVPPAVLMLASQVVPLYVGRYVLFALAGAPLLVAHGLDLVLSRLVRWAPVRVAGVPVLAAGVVLSLGAGLAQADAQRWQRSPLSRADDLGAVARAFDRFETRRGDAVLFVPINMRQIAMVYRAPFRGLDDVALRRTGARSGTLYGVDVSRKTLARRLRGHDRVWVLRAPALSGGYSVSDVAKSGVLRAQFRHVSSTTASGVELERWDRRDRS